MPVNRRQWLASAGWLAGAPLRLPLQSEFPVTHAEVCLNNARWHPLGVGARRAIDAYLDYKASGGGAAADYGSKIQQEAKTRFSALIGARPAEISFVPSTLAGENLVVAALGLPVCGGNVVTDALHFEGSLYLYGELEKQGLDVRTVRPRNWRIGINDIDAAVDRQTKLVAVSLVSMLNGFEHDLKAVSDIAHARGALVFADIVQAAGAVPIDVRASGVDFCSCSSYKWLMGDMGLGFLYVREGLLGKAVKRAQYGYRQLSRMDYHLFPHEPPGERIFDWEQRTDAGGYFEVGTVANTTAAAVAHSLALIEQLGVANIQRHRQPLLNRLQREMPRLGYQPLTPAESTSPIVSFAVADTTRVARRLQAARVDVAVYEHRLRISPSVYNGMDDIEKLLDCLD